ncbi:MAG: hypothetical protein AB7O59_22725 [Pirellulales bacterium]
MSFRNDRRRRLVSDELSAAHHRDEAEGDERSSDSAHEESHAKRAYATAADEALDRPLAACFPASYLMISLLLTAGIGLVAALLVAHTFTVGMTDPAHTVHTRLFDVVAPGNATHWLASMLSAAAAVVAVYIYGLRRHLLHDYHGRYRMWIWTALACLAVSFGEGTSAAASLRALCGHLATLFHLNNNVAWPALVGSLLVAISLRIGGEVRRCGAALALLLLAAVSAGVATAASSQRLAESLGAHAPLVARGGWLTGYLFGLAMMFCYARHVTGEIEGKIAVTVKVHKRRKKHKKVHYAETDDEAAAATHHRHKHKHVRTDLDPEEPTSSKSSHAHDRHHAASVPMKSSSQATTRDDDEEGEDAGDTRDGRPLSRKERRRLRRDSQMRAA